MAVRHRTAASRRNGVQLVVGEEATEMAPRVMVRAKELIVRVIHLIDLEHHLETAFVERTVVRYEGQTLDQRL